MRKEPCPLGIDLGHFEAGNTLHPQYSGVYKGLCCRKSYTRHHTQDMQIRSLAQSLGAGARLDPERQTQYV